MTHSFHKQIKFTDNDIVNIDDWIPGGDVSYSDVRPWLLHDHGFVLAVVFADCEQDAIDIACDGGRLDHYAADQDEIADSEKAILNGAPEYLSPIGNFCKLHDIESLGIEELPNPPLSFCACLNSGGRSLTVEISDES